MRLFNVATLSLFVAVWAVLSLHTAPTVFAQNFFNQDPKASLFFSPSTGHFLVGSTFDVSIFVNTDNQDINAVDVNVKFPSDILQVVNPSTGQSFISIWAAQPSYSNEKGTLSFSGGVPSPGLNTSSGLVSRVTFRVKRTGTAVLEFLPTSQVLANDSRGTNILHTTERVSYNLVPKAPDGPILFSPTHPDETLWYNNSNFSIGWEAERGADAYSFVLDTFPSTVPDNESDTANTSVSFEDLQEGIWYFHIISRKNNIWGGVSHFSANIDTVPPAKFKPEVDLLSTSGAPRSIVSFFTTDNLSGISHYEVAVIDGDDSYSVGSPIFIEAESPYRLPDSTSGNIRVLIRVYDNAGNIREEAINSFIKTSNISFSLFGEDVPPVLLLVILVFSALVLWHFFFKHRFLGRLLRAEGAFFRSWKKGPEFRIDKIEPRNNIGNVPYQDSDKAFHIRTFFIITFVLIVLSLFFFLWMNS